MDYKELLGLVATGESETVEFKRKINDKCIESICAFSNTFGGKVVVGISDNLKITGVIDPEEELRKLSDMISSMIPSVAIRTEVLKVDSTNVIIVEVERSSSLHSFRNIAYVRAGRNNKPINPQELLMMAGESLMVSFDTSPSRVLVEDVSEKLIDKFYLVREEARGLRAPGHLRIDERLVQLGVANKVNDGLVLNAAGVLFFTYLPQSYYSSACIEVMQFTDDTMNELLYRERLEGSLPEMVEKAFDILEKNNPTVELLLPGNLRRKRMKVYPVLAIREALLNAVIHRNYYDPGYTQIFIFPDRISIRNPGAFPFGVTPEHPIHKPRNPLISSIMYELGYVEKYGSGINRIRMQVEEQQGVEFRYDEYIFYTEISFIRRVNLSAIDELNRKILELLETRNKSSELSQALEMSIPTIVKRLNDLVSAGIIIKVGKGKNTQYRLSNKY